MRIDIKTMVLVAILIATIPTVSAQGFASASRHIENPNLPAGGSTQVTVTVNSEVDNSFLLRENLPSTRWNITRVTDDANNMYSTPWTSFWTWNSLPSGTTTTVVYNLNVPSDESPGAFKISGELADNMSDPYDENQNIYVEGDNVINVIPNDSSTNNGSFVDVKSNGTNEGTNESGGDNGVSVSDRFNITANSVWTNTNLTINTNDIISIKASGNWNSGSGNIGPDGGDTTCCDFDMFLTDPPAKHGELIAYVGSDPYKGEWGNGTFFPQKIGNGYWSIGSNNTFTSDRSGKLWLGINDDAVNKFTRDNSGSLIVSVKITPGDNGNGNTGNTGNTGNGNGNTGNTGNTGNGNGNTGNTGNTGNGNGNKGNGNGNIINNGNGNNINTGNQIITQEQKNTVINNVNNVVNNMGITNTQIIDVNRDPEQNQNIRARVKDLDTNEIFVAIVTPDGKVKTDIPETTITDVNNIFTGNHISFQFNNNIITNYKIDGKLIFSSINLGFVPTKTIKIGKEFRLSDDKNMFVIHDNEQGIFEEKSSTNIQASYQVATGVNTKISGDKRTEISKDFKGSILSNGEQSVSGNNVNVKLNQGTNSKFIARQQNDEFEDRITEGISHKQIGSIINIDSLESHDVTYFSVDTTINKIIKNTISLNVNSETHDGKVIALKVNKDVLRDLNIRTLVDGVDIEKAKNFDDLFKNDKLSYLIVIGQDIEILISIPEFSEHQVVVTSEAPTLTATPNNKPSDISGNTSTPAPLLRTPLDPILGFIAILTVAIVMKRGMKRL